ncbi:hypothetical protein V495_05251 [Pseudogymnoascus sp. VKM F-4514 (FW-929)]|nr:hypothetical protein V495_05251 [Pseudogymnoascus sp. VKM F-4514 (FW-929)]KFY60551.1 hypothetical protein V497_03554 [Pseudogymnoascus sp. VKM F-4516 (FW-969)]
MHYLSLATIVGVASTASAHGVITSPTPRIAGNASLAACGTAVQLLNTQDVTTHVEGLPEVAAVDSTYHPDECNLWLCKGLQLDEEASGPVQTYSPGEVVPIDVNLRILHDGTANVSIVDTASNTIVGSQLLYWDDYANEKLPSVPENNTHFSITIPDDIEEGKCTTAGECVIQWWWYGVAADQTYESCIDFVLGDAAPSSRIRRK